MTVPAMRRAGHTLHVMSAPANLSPWPSRSRPPRSRSAAPRSAGAHIHLVHLVGLVDPSAAAALLVGALPVIEVLRRRPSRILDRSYAWAHVGLPTVAVARCCCRASHGDDGDGAGGTGRSQPDATGRADHLPSDPPRVVRGEERGDVGHVVGLADPANVAREATSVAAARGRPDAGTPAAHIREDVHHDADH